MLSPMCQAAKHMHQLASWQMHAQLPATALSTAVAVQSKGITTGMKPVTLR
jgi:hypothetical protein